MPLNLTRSHLRQHVEMLLKRDKLPESWLAIGFRCDPEWTGGDAFEAQGQSFHIRKAQSVLEFRDHLAEAGANRQRLVILSNLLENELGADLCARLLKCRLQELDPWDTVREAFRATQVDYRIQSQEQIAWALIEHQPPEGFPAVSTGVLDEETVWEQVCRHVLGLPSARLTPTMLLRQELSGESNRWGKLRNAAPAILEKAFGWMDSVGQRTVALMLRCASRGKGEDLLPLGLVCGILFDPEGVGEVGLRQAEVRLEGFLGEKPLSTQGREWADAANGVLKELKDREKFTRLRFRAEELLKEFKAEAYAYFSDWLPLGYEQRLARFAHVAARAFSDDQKNLQELPDAVQAVRRHVDGQGHHDEPERDHRNRKVEMAARLILWLSRLHAAGTKLEKVASLEEACRLYSEELCFVDWARETLSAGDPVHELRGLYQSLWDAVFARREAFNRRFGELVASWNLLSKRPKELLLIEEVLSRVVAQVAKKDRVLVLVMDGLSMAITQELLADLEAPYGWALVESGHLGAKIPVLSTVPSITQYARASLLAGKLTKGDSREEKIAFTSNQALRSVSSGTHHPVLFHKDEIEEKPRQGLSPAVKKALANAQIHVVGLVLNAVDDELLKGDQMYHPWRVDAFRVLEEILTEARNAKRLIVLVSDHGHVVDRMSERQAKSEESGERWAKADRKALDGELTFDGPRVAPFVERVLAPWTETVRYAGKHHGFHGGITPQELLVPCCVLAHTSHPKEESWKEVHRGEPLWWNLAMPAEQVVAQAKAVVEQDEVPVELPLFEKAASSKEPVGRRWVDDLLQSQRFKEHHKLAGRTAPPPKEVVKALEILDEAGGRLPAKVFIGKMNKPEIRLHGYVAVLRRVLNVEGYRIIEFTSDGGHIELDKQLLMKQFDLTQGATDA